MVEFDHFDITNESINSRKLFRKWIREEFKSRDSEVSIFSDFIFMSRTCKFQKISFYEGIEVSSTRSSLLLLIECIHLYKAHEETLSIAAQKKYELDEKSNVVCQITTLLER